MRTEDKNNQAPKQEPGTDPKSTNSGAANSNQNRKRNSNRKSGGEKTANPSTSGQAEGAKPAEVTKDIKTVEPQKQTEKTSAPKSSSTKKESGRKRPTRPKVQHKVLGETFSWNDAGEVCRLDGKLYSTQSNPNEEILLFVKENQYSYYIACNTWMSILQDISNDPLPEIARSILSGGLAPMITLANSLSNALLVGVQLPPSPFGYFVRSVTQVKNADEVMRYTLQGLRFLKRFSPTHTTSLINDELIAFQRRNTQMKLFDEVSINPIHVLGLRHVLRDTFRGWERKFSQAKKAFDYFSYLPTNATCDTGITRTSKWDSILTRFPFVTQLTPPPQITVNSLTDKKFEYRYCEVSAIPKSYKARRIIATEECYRQTQMWTIMETLDKCLENRRGKYAPGGRALMHDQDRNRQLARKGSEENYFATLDCSAASDTVSWWLVREVFPPALFSKMNKLRSEYMHIREANSKSVKTKRLYMFSSMGSRMTFPVEMILFWGIACYACTIASGLLGDHFDPNEVSVFGDDTIVPSRYAEVVLHYLEVFGFSPNREKSFYQEEGFRESCGIECYHGVDVSSVYFPRSSVTDDVAGVIRLISLQHRTFQYRKTSNFLCSVLASEHNVLYSLPYQPNNCLWVDFPEPKYGIIPRTLYKTQEAYEYACVHSDMRDYELETKIVNRYESSISPLSRELAEQLAYLDFLKEGPRYDNQLDRKDGISMPPLPRKALASTSTSYLRNLRK